MLAQIFRFGFVGALATLVHVLAGLAAQSAFDLPVQAANLAGFCAAVFVSYLGHMRFTFAVRTGTAAQLLRFVVLSGLSLLTSSATVWVITAQLGASFSAAMVAVAIVVPAASFVAMRLWVFASAPGNQDP